MKAALFEKHGGPENIRVNTAPDPVAGPGDAVVRVHACALNHLDLWVLQGIPAYPVALPHVPGSDIAGVVESVGDGVTAVQPGERVLVSPGISCFQCPPCRAGRDNLCETFSILGAKRWGGLAEKVAVPAANLLLLPSALEFPVAAALPVSYMTAWHMLTRAGLRADKTVLVVGASSGVGSAAVQIAKSRGARVLATATSAEKAALARELGADAVVNTAEQSIAHVARAWTDKRGVDIIIEHVGPATWEQSIGSLAPGGTLVTCGNTTGPEVKLELRYLFGRELSILGNRVGTREDLTNVVQCAAQGEFRPRLAKTFPLAETAAALAMMAERRHFGKIVVLP